ncbi:MAG: M1 family metallopeptidase [Flavobacteriales bacterium]
MKSLIAIALALLFSSKTKVNNIEYVENETEKTVYNESAKREFDLLHTDLNVSFDWKKQQLIGEASLLLKPYYHSSNKLKLDAKGFFISTISINRKPLKYSYDGLIIDIDLEQTYTRNDTFTIDLQYIAKPNELDIEGSDAITDAKGLYFINPEDKEGKPQQIWTQGETEASSCWFPTIDKPNERMTQNIAITVAETYTTLSNGLLVESRDNEDGTRTDFWEQTQPHAPYLAMMGIGKFNITKDQWREKEVSYYLEDDYHSNARKIFGRTPEMMSHFSEILGVDYPWEKYTQIVVRDFVSGAMENTGAVIHGEFVQMTERELVDKHEDDIIAHELFHHWFGNLVTCESWANLPLNEAFATYGEYIWREKWKGRMSADYHLEKDLQNYLNESRIKQVDMIRFDYSDKEDMFDNHSYAKGGRVLHMLRYYLGDEAFYDGLNKYLVDNAYSTVEIHQLRLAMEEVSGEDLNWFFNQWFLSSGHPLLVIDYQYDSTQNTQTIIIEQIQDLANTPLYRLPFSIDIYEDQHTHRHNIIMTEKKQQFEFPVSQYPNNVIVDAEHVLLAEMFDEKPDSWWLNQLHAPLFMDHKIALENISDKNKINAIQHGLNNDFWAIRQLAVNAAMTINNPIELLGIIEQIAQFDDNTTVRADAIEYLYKRKNVKEYEALFEDAAKHKSLKIASSALKGLAKIDIEKALQLVSLQEKDLKFTAAKLYSEHSGPEKALFFDQLLSTTSGYSLYYSTTYYTAFLKNQDINFIIENTLLLEQSLDRAPSWMTRLKPYCFGQLKETVEEKLKTTQNNNIKDKANQYLIAIEKHLQ